MMLFVWIILAFGNADCSWSWAREESRFWFWFAQVGVLLCGINLGLLVPRSKSREE